MYIHRQNGHLGPDYLTTRQRAETEPTRFRLVLEHLISYWHAVTGDKTRGRSGSCGRGGPSGDRPSTGPFSTVLSLESRVRDILDGRGGHLHSTEAPSIYLSIRIYPLFIVDSW